MAQQTAAPAIPFAVASQYSTRPSFDIPVQTLQAAAPTQVSPVQIPAVGYLQGLLLEITLDGENGTDPQYTADGPWNVIQSINFRNAAGVNLIAPLTGFDLFLVNLLGGQGQPGFGPYADPRFGFNFDATTPDAHFFLWLPLGLDPSDAYGVIPALASNANYQMEISLAAIATVFTGAPDVTVSISATAHYFDLPAATDQAGRSQATTPPSVATSVWQKESPTVSPGTQLTQSFNVGNVIRNHILVLRNSDGARIETNGWPALTELYLDNQPRFSFSKTEWEFLQARWHGLEGTAKSSVLAGALPLGVFNIPYHALLGSASGDPANTRAQLLPTLNATLLQFRFQDFGSAASRLEILTEAVTTTDAAYLYSK
jgi:hypothetical protein